MIYYDKGRFYAGDISFLLPNRCYMDPFPDVVPNGFLLHSLEHDYFDLEISVSHYEDDYKHDFEEQIVECSRKATFSYFIVNNVEGFSARYAGIDGESFEVVFPMNGANAAHEDGEDENALTILIHVPSPYNLQTVLNLPFTQQLFSSFQRVGS